jgi:hypothetical protein
LAQTAVDPGGTTTVLCAGGVGEELLKLKHPPSANGISRANSERRMAWSSSRV